MSNKGSTDAGSFCFLIMLSLMLMTGKNLILSLKCTSNTAKLVFLCDLTLSNYSRGTSSIARYGIDILSYVSNGWIFFSFRTISNKKDRNEYNIMWYCNCSFSLVVYYKID